MKEILTFQWRLLTFRASPEELHRLGWKHLAAGLLWTWAVGIGRWWDDPTAHPMQVLGIGSVAYVFVLALALWAVFLPLRPTKWTYFKVLTVVCLTAPPAILYAIPVERWMPAAEAASLNLWFLLVVAVWRVSLWGVCAHRICGLSGWEVGLATALPLIGTMIGLTVLRVARRTLELMAGYRAPAAEDDAARVITLLGGLSFYGFIPAVLAYLYRSVKRRASRS